MQLELSELEEGRSLAAQLVTRYGPAFLPAFERFDAEIKAYHEREARLAEVKKIAEKGAD